MDGHRSRLADWDGDADIPYRLTRSFGSIASEIRMTRSRAVPHLSGDRGWLVPLGISSCGEGITGLGSKSLRDRREVVAAVEDLSVRLVHTQDRPKVTGGRRKPVRSFGRILGLLLLHEDCQRTI